MIDVDGVEWLTVKQAAERWRIKPGTLYLWVARGHVETHTDGQRMWLNVQDILEREHAWRTRRGGTPRHAHGGVDIPRPKQIESKAVGQLSPQAGEQTLPAFTITPARRATHNNKTPPHRGQTCTNGRERAGTNQRESPCQTRRSDHAAPPQTARTWSPGGHGTAPTTPPPTRPGVATPPNAATVAPTSGNATRGRPSLPPAPSSAGDAKN